MAKTSTASFVLVVLVVALILNGCSAAEDEGRGNQLVKDEAGILNSAAADGDGRVNQPVKDEADWHHDDDDDDDHKKIKKVVIFFCFNINKLCGKDRSYCSRYTKICSNIGHDSIVAKSGNPKAENLP